MEILPPPGNVTLVTAEHYKAISKKATILMSAMIESGGGASDTSLSEWSIALMYVAAEIVRAAPPDLRGIIVDELQKCLLHQSSVSE